MYLSYYFKRIFSNKLKLAVALLFFFFPVADIYLILMEISRGGSVPYPFLASFLVGIFSKWGQQLLLWYLPLYLLLVVADDCIEDVKIGYKNILVTKWGKGRYVFHNLVKGFLVSFLLLFLSLVLNLLMTQIAFHEGFYSPSSSSLIEQIPSLQVAYQNPMLTNCIYILIASFLSGIVGLGAAAISMMLPNRFLAYPIIFLLWYFPSIVHPPIQGALQPFTEYSLVDVSSTVFLVIGINILAAVAAYIKVMKYDQI